MKNKKMKKEEQKQHLIDMMKYDENLGLYEEPKQEITHEELAQWTNEYKLTISEKWQQERMYTEEDMAESFMACWKANVFDGIECKLSFKEWFEQFKKK
jgi:hypothetical protein